MFKILWSNSLLNCKYLVWNEVRQITRNGENNLICPRAQQDTHKPWNRFLQKQLQFHISAFPCSPLFSILFVRNRKSFNPFFLPPWSVIIQIRSYPSCFLSRDSALMKNVSNPGMEKAGQTQREIWLWKMRSLLFLPKRLVLLFLLIDHHQSR